MLPLMEKTGLELSLLSRFVIACQSPRLSDAAAQLGQTPSALTMALQNLEARLGLQLFTRRAGGMDLLPPAYWLFRMSTQLLYAEQRIREGCPHQARNPAKLSIRLDLNFVIGRVSKALLRTCQQLIEPFPELAIEWHFSGLEDDDIGEPQGLGAMHTRPVDQGHIRIFYGSRHAVPDHATSLYNDRWIVVGSHGSGVAKSAAHDHLTLLRMSGALVDAMTASAHQQGFAARLQFRDTEPVHLGEILYENPHLRLLMPSSLLPTRLGLARHEQTPFEPRFSSIILAEGSGGAERYREAFLKTLHRNMSEDRTVVFTPSLSARQVHFFNLAVHTGSISAAARVANTAQSSVSRHITQMEETVGGALLHRTEEGATLSPLGNRVRPLAAIIEDRQDWILRKARDIAAHSEARVTIGTLPSSGHDSALTEKIAHVVTRIHARHPDWQLQVVENSNTVLHERVRSGELNLAVVGMVNSQVARIRLGPSEPLSVIGNPAINFGGRKVLGLEDVVALPLALGRHHLSIHQSFAEAARARGLKLRPAVEVGSLALAIAMVRQAPLCTILPASSVRQDIEAGNLLAVPIREEDLSGALSLIFSAERELSDAERTIMQEFVRVFRPGRENEAADHEPV